MKVAKFVFRCIFEGLKVIIPIIFIITMLSIIMYYMSTILGEEIFIIVLVIILLLFLAFIIGIAKIENKRLKR